MGKAIKLLINSEAGVGKTSLLSSLGVETFVVSRDAKDFNLPIPHMLVDKWYSMDIFLYGGVVKEGGESVTIAGVADKINTYAEKTGKAPENVAIDSVSQIWLDVIEKASLTPNVYGSQGAEVTMEMGKLVKFIHEFLELNGVNVILLNHIIKEKADGTETGVYIPFGTGKFLSKGAFYSTVNEAITIIASGQNRVVYTRDINKMARTSLTDIPSKLAVENIVNPEKSKKLEAGQTEYFTLKSHINTLVEIANKAEEFRI